VIDDLWYKNAIIYCLDVAKYVDANGDGVGDFAGLTRRLDYLSGMGVTCIWLQPFFPSPNRDNGYDVSDHYGVDPKLGTIGEFVEFMNHAEQLGLRVIVETVVETTGATGGLVVGLGGEIVQSGTISDRGETFELPLTAGRQSFGTLTLSGRDFTVDQRRTAATLVAHAAIALENARLHRIVARQALVDMLTGLEVPLERQNAPIRLVERSTTAPPRSRG